MKKANINKFPDKFKLMCIYKIHGETLVSISGSSITILCMNIQNKLHLNKSSFGMWNRERETPHKHYSQSNNKVYLKDVQNKYSETNSLNDTNLNKTNDSKCVHYSRRHQFTQVYEQTCHKRRHLHENALIKGRYWVINVARPSNYRLYDSVT